MLHIGRDFLLPVESVCVTTGLRKAIGLREEPLATLKVLEPHSLHIRCQEAELAEAVVSMPMKRSHQASELVLPREISEFTVSHGGAEVTTNVVACADIEAKHVEKFLDHCQRVLRPIQLFVSPRI